MHSKNEVMIKKRPKLRAGSLALYVLFCKSVDEKRVLTRKEIFAIYKGYVAEGQGDRYIYIGDGKERHGVWRVTEWDDWEWKRNFENWFTRTLGSLLQKGYLRVVPAMDLSECDMSKLLEIKNGKEKQKEKQI